MIKPSQRDPSGRRGVRRAVVLMPNGLTLFNLFCGIYAIVLAVRGDIASAPTFIVLGGIADVLDGRVARATGTGSRFGEELDSLVDAISFGFAPALIMYIGLMGLPKTRACRTNRRRSASKPDRITFWCDKLPD